MTDFKEDTTKNFEFLNWKLVNSKNVMVADIDVELNWNVLKLIREIAVVWEDIRLR